MGQTNFSFVATSQTISRIEEATSSAKTALDDVKYEVETQLGNVNVWSGSSANEVKGRWLNFIENFDSFVEKFNGESIKARKAAEIYTKTDEEAAN